LPTERAESYLAAGKVDGDWSRVEGFGAHIPGLVKVLEPVAVHSYVAYSNQRDILVAGWDSLKAYKVAHLARWRAIEENLEPIHSDLYPTTDVESGLSFVLAGRAGLFVCIPFLMNRLLQSDEKFKDEIHALEPQIDVFETHIFLLAKYGELENKISSALRAMKNDKTYNRLLGSEN
jgi:hypothetical protein